MNMNGAPAYGIQPKVPAVRYHLEPWPSPKPTATYQTLGIDREDGDPSFLFRHYPENYFSHIVIDECHRSAWGK